MPTTAARTPITSCRSGRLIIAALLTLLAGGCRKPTPAPPRVPGDGPSANPVLLIAVDGLEWKLVLQLLQGGLMPNLAGLIERGEFGLLETFEPTASPVIWTSVATGKDAAHHGISGFDYRGPDGKRRLFTNTQRKTKALWNILSDYGLTVATVGWWMTFPVEPINGVMVAQTNTMAQVETSHGQNIWKGSLVRGVPGQVYPPERQNEMVAVLEEVDRELPFTLPRIFRPFQHDPSLLGERLWDACQWAFRADATYLQIATQLAAQRPAYDLLLVYVGGTDVVGHRFWRYMEPTLYRHPPAPEQIENFRGVIRDYYSYLDRSLGQLLDAADPNATVMLLSDHGMLPVNLEAKFNPNDPPTDVNSAHHYNAPPGVFIAAGPHIRRAARDGRAEALRPEDLRTVGDVYDITPTILALLRIPLGQDMRGRVLADIVVEDFDIGRQPAPLKSHDTREFIKNRPEPPAGNPAEEDRIRQLRALGYITDDGE
ncbi:MAG: alkaline phosphatase family protein [Planctomycetes bacterium]|nr:alkaline phosphatase family protein [Planctomycetota bacterium]